MHRLPAALLLSLLLFSQMTLVSEPVYAQDVDEGERRVSLVAASDSFKYLTPSIPSASGVVVVDGADLVTVSFGSISQTLEITLVDPNGAGVSVRSAGTASVQPWLDPEASELPDPEVVGALYSYSLTNPIPGQWTYLIEEPAAIQTSLTVLVTMLSTSPVRTGVLGVRRQYTLDDDVCLGLVTVEDTQALTNVVVTAELTKEGVSGPLAAVTFRDNGQDGDVDANDGLFSAIVMPSSPGGYAVTATVTGTRSDGQAFVRVASSSFQVKTTVARLLGGFVERSIGSPLIDSIGIAPQIRVVESGAFRVTITLTGSNGRFSTVSGTASLEAGDRSLEVLFAGRRLAGDIGVDGPYSLSTVRLERLAGAERELVDENPSAGLTAAYALNSFAGDPVQDFVGGTIVPVDTNGNGKFDHLDLEIPLTFVVSGTYTWSAQLQTLSGTLITTAANSGELPSTPGPIPAGEFLHLLFSGSAIGEAGQDGPYRVRLFQITGTGGSSTFPEVCMTPRFAASEFEGFCTLGCPADVSVGIGPNASGCGIAVTYPAPSTTGNCSAVTCVPASGEVFPIGTTTVNCSTASLFSCSFTVTVTDTTSPVVTCPAPLSTTLTSGCVAAVPDVVALSSATDNCTPSGSLVLTQSPTAGTMVAPGMHTITVSAVDAASNIETCTTTFTVIDGQSPTITGPNPAIYLAMSSSPSGVAVTFPTPTATDNCSGVSVTTNPVSGTVFPIGKTLVTATAIDAAGLTSSTQFAVKVVRFGESIGIYIPSTAAWFLRNANTNGGADLTFTFGPGGDGWVPVAGDWDRSGTDTAGLFYNPTAGVFLSDTNVAGGADYVFTYGPSDSGWIPIAGDWNGEGVDSIGLYDPGTGNFFLKNINAAGNADVILQLGPGNAGYVPIVGDWNGDGIDTVGIYNSETGVFFLRNANTNGPADVTFTFGAGGKGYLPISGDWDGDNVCTIGLYDPSSGAFVLRNSNDNGPADVEFTFGSIDPGTVPVAGNWDGDIP